MAPRSTVYMVGSDRLELSTFPTRRDVLAGGAFAPLPAVLHRIAVDGDLREAVAFDGGPPVMRLITRSDLGVGNAPGASVSPMTID